MDVIRSRQDIYLFRYIRMANAVRDLQKGLLRPLLPC